MNSKFHDVWLIITINKSYKSYKSYKSLLFIFYLLFAIVFIKKNLISNFRAYIS